MGINLKVLFKYKGLNERILCHWWAGFKCYLEVIKTAILREYLKVSHLI